MGVGACGRARSSAGQENFGEDFAFRGEHLERSGFHRTFAGFNTFAGIRSEESGFASASRFADTGAQWIGVLARSIASFALTEFFVGFACFGHDRLDLSDAFAGFDTFSSIRSEESGFASASRFADTRAQWIGVLARSIATFALTEFFVDFAFLDRWEHHEGFNLGRAFAGFNAFSIIVTEMTFFASATRNADTRAQWVGVFARSVASFALTVFFVIAAHLSLDWQSFGSRYAASFRMNAYAVFVFQKSGFAEATDDAIASADRARMWVGARGWASGSASEEHFVVFALRNFRGISEKLHGFGGIAFGGWHANAASISQMTFIAEATDDAVLGANRARIWIGAGWSAS